MLTKRLKTTNYLILNYGSGTLMSRDTELYQSTVANEAIYTLNCYSTL